VLPSSGPCPYYMITLIPSGNKTCVKYTYQRLLLGTECSRWLKRTVLLFVVSLWNAREIEEIWINMTFLDRMYALMFSRTRVSIL
jgi:hypothetical protein